MSTTPDIPMKIVLIGSGNLATNIAVALIQRGYSIVDIYSRTLQSAKALALKIEAPHYTDNIKNIYPKADLYLFAVSDSAISELATQMPETTGIWTHTSGSTSMEVLQKVHYAVGVLYPLQTFSKADIVNFQETPIFVEADSDSTQRALLDLAKKLSERVFLLSSSERRYLHLAAVFACNFVNGMYTIAADILQRHDIDFQAILPLIDKTAQKVHYIPPLRAQTGPAIRSDHNIMNKHMQLLDDNPKLQDIYHLISNYIYEKSKNNEFD